MALGASWYGPDSGGKNGARICSLVSRICSLVYTNPFMLWVDDGGPAEANLAPFLVGFVARDGTGKRRRASGLVGISAAVEGHHEGPGSDQRQGGLLVR